MPTKNVIDSSASPAEKKKKIRKMDKNVNYWRAHRTYDKIFGIGATKTATSSLNNFFRTVGFKVGPQNEGMEATYNTLTGNLKPLANFIERFEAFQDGPFATGHIYACLDALFPNSKFILSYRDPEKWFNSLCRFHAKAVGVDDYKDITQEKLAKIGYYRGIVPEFFEYIFLNRIDDNLNSEIDWSLLYDKDTFINSYMNRNKDIIKYFSNRPDDLLVIDITQETDTSRVVEFLNLPEMYVMDMPWKNKT